MRRNLIVLFVVVVGLVGAGWWYVSKRAAAPPQRVDAVRGDAPAQSMPSVSSGMVSTVPATGADTTPTVAVAPPLPAAQPESDIARRFLAATDYKSLLDELVRSPSAEAPYFAAKILKHCADVSRYGLKQVVVRFGIDNATGPPESQAARMDAFRKMHLPCAGFEGRRFMADQIAAKRQEGIDRADPRSLAQALASGEMGPGADTLAVAATLLERNDPHILNELSTYLAGASTGVRTIGGQPLDPGDFRAAELAWKMVSCDFGSDCGPDSDMVRAGCAYSAICGMGSYEDLIRNGFARDEGEYRRALEFRAKILDALRRRDYASFGLSPRR